MDDSVPILTWSSPTWWILIAFVVSVVGLMVLAYRAIPGDLEPAYHPSTPGQDYEALMCVLADPVRNYPERTQVLAGRAALRILIRKGEHGPSPS